MEVGGQRHAPSALPRERPATHCMGGWAGPRAGQDPGPVWSGAENLDPPGYDPRTFQPLASRYTDWAIRSPYWHVPVPASKNCKCHFCFCWPSVISEPCLLFSWNCDVAVSTLINPLTPELNPSAQRCLTRYFTGDFASWTVHVVNICVKNQLMQQLFIQFINYVW
jgi:hypothetical protein